MVTPKSPSFIPTIIVPLSYHPSCFSLYARTQARQGGDTSWTPRACIEKQMTARLCNRSSMEKTENNKVRIFHSSHLEWSCSKCLQEGQNNKGWEGQAVSRLCKMDWPIRKPIHFVWVRFRSWAWLAAIRWRWRGRCCTYVSFLSTSKPAYIDYPLFTKVTCRPQWMYADFQTNRKAPGVEEPSSEDWGGNEKWLNILVDEVHTFI